MGIFKNLVSLSTILFLPAICLAQFDTATVLGTVRDASGAVVSGSKPTTNARGLDRPKRPANRASYTAGGMFEAIVTVNLSASGFGTALSPACEK